MPCPYFEPLRRVIHLEHSNARLPLIDEYEGSCHAGASPIPAPAQYRFRCCNHGYSRGCCEHFPAADERSCLRYTLLQRTRATLDLLCVEEQDYAPLKWHSVQYFFETGQLAPEIADSCVRAQVLAFCRSYLARFSS